MEIAAVTLALIDSFQDKIKSTLSFAKDETLQAIDSGLKSYVESYRLKFIQTKTFLFRESRVDFEKTYLPVTLQGDKGKLKISSIESLYSAGNYISVIGGAGSGKSMQMKDIFLKAIHQNVKIPIFIELKTLGDYPEGLTQFFYDKILNNKLARSRKIVERLLDAGMFIILLDGYDEIYSNNKLNITTELEEFIDIYSKNRFIITSRPGAGIESFPRFDNFYVLSLTSKEVNIFIKKQCEIINDSELADKIISVIKRPENRPYKEYISNPLLLSMFLFTFRNFPTLPKKISSFYWNVYNTLTTKHDSFTKKGGWQHERESGLQNDDIEEILMWFGYLSFMEGVNNLFSEEYLNEIFLYLKKNASIEFDTKKLIYDLSVNLNIFQLDGVEYSFPHRSMQEYFAVKLISGQDEADKKEIYSDSLDNYFQSTFDASTNFMRLCMELDEKSFIKYHIIPTISDFLKLFDGLSGEKMIRTLFEITETEASFHFGGGRLEQIISTSGKLKLNSLFSFLKIGSIHSNVIGEIADKIHGSSPFEMLSNDDDSETWFDLNSGLDPMKEDNFLNFLIELGFLDIVENFLKDVEAKKNEYQSKVKSERKGIRKLLRKRS